MRNLWILTRFLLKSGPGKSNQKSGKKKAFSDGGRIVVYLLLGVCLLPVSVLLFLLGYSGYTFLQPLGLPEMLFFFSCILCAFSTVHESFLTTSLQFRQIFFLLFSCSLQKSFIPCTHSGHNFPVY